MTEFLLGMLSNALGELVADLFGESLAERADRRALQRALEVAVIRAERQFATEYAAHDPELATALTSNTRFADLPSVRAALRELLARPFHDPGGAVGVLRGSFADVLPERVERARVDAAVKAFLAALGREVLYIPQLRELYALSFGKLSAESGRATAEHTAAMAHSVAAVAASIGALREDLRLLAAPELRLLAAPRPPAERPRPWHNLPQRSYAEFIGRHAERAQLTRLLLPHPRSRHFVVTVDGIGGVGKSALALELAYGYREQHAALPEPERFAAIVWVSAKRTLLTAGGIQQRRQSFNTLDDLFRELATVLEQPALMQASPDERRSLVEHALTAQRTLLIVDNLETVDDEELLSFLRELPDPTKAIITTRHRIDIAYAIRLTGMAHEDAQRLMQVESEAKGVRLAPAELDELERRTGGVPLAMQWSIGLMSLGHSVEVVLRRLGQGQSDIARFCFDESAARIRGRDAHRLLLALALFERSVQRDMLGEVAGLADDPIGRDEGLAELLRLSLVNQKGERFQLLPLTHAFARGELEQHPELARALRERWLETLIALVQPYRVPHHLQPSPGILLREGQHLKHLAHWAEQEQRLDVYLAVLPGLLVHYDVTGNWSALLEICRQGLEYGDLLGVNDSDRVLYSVMAWVQSQQAAHDDAAQAVSLALESSRSRSDLAWEVEALGRFAQVVRRAGDTVRAAELCDEALALIERLPPEQQAFARGDIEFERAKLARDGGDYALARTLFLEAQRIFPIDSDAARFNPERAWGIAGNVGFTLHQLGELDEAAELYRRSLEFFRQSGGRGYTATLLTRFAALEQQRGNHAAARTYAEEALELSQRLKLVVEQRQATSLLTELDAMHQPGVDDGP